MFSDLSRNYEFNNFVGRKQNRMINLFKWGQFSDFTSKDNISVYTLQCTTLRL